MENWRKYILNEDGAQGSTPEYLTRAHKDALASGIEKYPKFKHFISKAMMDPKYGSLRDDWGASTSAAQGHQIGRVSKEYSAALRELSQINDEAERHPLIQILSYYVTKLKKKEGIEDDFLKNLPGPVTTQDRERFKI